MTITINKSASIREDRVKNVILVKSNNIRYCPCFHLLLIVPYQNRNDAKPPYCCLLLGRALGELQDDIEQIPSGSTGPFRDELVSMYQDYVTKNRLFKAGPESLAAEFDRDVALAADPETSSDTALERVRTEHEAVPPPNVAQTGQGIDRHLENVLSTMNAMSDRSRRLHPAEMSVAVQNMRGAPLAASYVQPRDAADPEYIVSETRV